MSGQDLAIVVAFNGDRVIGAKGDMPWHIPEDLRHFKRVTMGHAILMGRKTYESIGRPLPGRRNIVITRNPNAVFEGCDIAQSLSQAIQMARDGGDLCPRVIGGGEIYKMALPLATELYLTKIDVSAEGDTFFPKIDWSQWDSIHERAGRRPGVLFLHLKRKL